jgi:hypothetical protein
LGKSNRIEAIGQIDIRLDGRREYVDALVHVQQEAIDCICATEHIKLIQSVSQLDLM